MADMNLGKQIGPLPLGAWIVVVGAGLGIAYYTTRSRTAPTVVEDGSVPSGVGTGGSGMFTELVPVKQPTDNAKPTTNEEWGVKAINWLIAMGYPSQRADSAIRKYLAGTKLGPDEYSLVGLALVSQGAPPQVLPPSEDEPPPTTTPPPTDNTTLPAPTGLHQYDQPPTWTFAVRADWNAVPGALGYELEEITGQAAGWTSPLVTGPVTAAMKLGLVHNGTYHVRIRAFNLAGKGAWSPAVVFRTHN